MKWDTALYDGRHAFVAQLGADLLAMLNPQPGERILDIGCGTGHLTQRIAQAGAQVTGLDNSGEMIAAARQAYPDIEFIVADASQFAFDRPFDAIFSNAALHWVHRAEEAVVCMSQSLRTGGRFVVEFGGRRNVEQIYQALEQVVLELTGNTICAANYFPSVSEYTSLLEIHGIEVVQAHLFDRFTQLDDGDDGLENWIRMFRGSVLEPLSRTLQAAVIDGVKTRLREQLFRDGAWHADYRRLRIVGFRV